jgi:pre-mRNA-processing factor 17
VDENRRFVTTSDDKTIRAWDWDIPVVIKYIAEPHMHSMPAVTLHPSSAFIIYSLHHPLFFPFTLFASGGCGGGGALMKAPRRTEKYFAAQSLDNQILIYNADNFRQNRKKRFAGHSVAGYACQVGFSPDGRFVGVLFLLHLVPLPPILGCSLPR